MRSLEILYACDEALRLIDAYEMPEKPVEEIHPCAATGYGCTEAPRGILYHRYRLDDQGVILDAKIVPPTSQNQKRKRPVARCPDAPRPAAGGAPVALGANGPQL